MSIVAMAESKAPTSHAGQPSIRAPRAASNATSSQRAEARTSGAHRRHVASRPAIANPAAMRPSAKLCSTPCAPARHAANAEMAVIPPTRVPRTTQSFPFDSGCFILAGSFIGAFFMSASIYRLSREAVKGGAPDFQAEPRPARVTYRRCGNRARETDCLADSPRPAMPRRSALGADRRTDA